MKQKYSITEAQKILVTGGYGTLGNYMHSIFSDQNIILTSKNTLNVTDKNQVVQKIKEYNPDFIIHLAALTDVDFCEENPEIAMNVNFEGTKNIVSECRKYDIPLVYISSAAVFDGKKPPAGGYSEKDTPFPSNVYARTKLLSEKFIQKSLKYYLIVRIGWLIGGGKKEKKFLSYIIERIQKGKTIYAVDDIQGTIAYAKDLAKFIKERILNHEFGLYHFGCIGVCSRFDMAVILKDMLNKEATIIPVNSIRFKKKFFAPRPQYEVLKSIKIPFKKPWKEVLKYYIKTEILK